jgi:hypothetical protein
MNGHKLATLFRGAYNHSPNASRIQDWQVKIHTPVYWILFLMCMFIYVFLYLLQYFFLISAATNDRSVGHITSDTNVLPAWSDGL